jgi:hypothetical protein
MLSLDEFIRTHRCALCWDKIRVWQWFDIIIVCCVNGCNAGYVPEKYVLEQLERQRRELHELSEMR